MTVEQAAARAGDVGHPLGDWRDNPTYGGPRLAQCACGVLEAVWYAVDGVTLLTTAQAPLETLLCEEGRTDA